MITDKVQVYLNAYTDWDYTESEINSKRNEIISYAKEHNRMDNFRFPWEDYE